MICAAERIYYTETSVRIISCGLLAGSGGARVQESRLRQATGDNVGRTRGYLVDLDFAALM